MTPNFLIVAQRSDHCPLLLVWQRDMGVNDTLQGGQNCVSIWPLIKVTIERTFPS